jgi:phage terminase large subunit
LQELIDKWGIETTFIDAAAAQFAADLGFLYNIATIKAKKSVLDGIGLVQTLSDQDRIKVSPHCEHTLYMFDQYRWDVKDTVVKERPEHGMASHMADALRYALYSYTIGG